LNQRHLTANKLVVYLYHIKDETHKNPVKHTSFLVSKQKPQNRKKGSKMEIWFKVSKLEFTFEVNLFERIGDGQQGCWIEVKDQNRKIFHPRTVFHHGRQCGRPSRRWARSRYHITKRSQKESRIYEGKKRRQFQVRVDWCRENWATKLGHAGERERENPY
jgi:hypothetical protein